MKKSITFVGVLALLFMNCYRIDSYKRAWAIYSTYYPSPKRLYAGDPLPKEKIAMLLEGKVLLQIKSINGIAIDMPKPEEKYDSKKTSWHDFFHLPPGEYYVEAEGQTIYDRSTPDVNIYGSLRGSCTLKFTAEAGKGYILWFNEEDINSRYDKKLKTNTYRSLINMFIMEVKTKKIVSEIIKKNL